MGKRKRGRRKAWAHKRVGLKGNESDTLNYDVKHNVSSEKQQHAGFPNNFNGGKTKAKKRRRDNHLMAIAKGATPDSQPYHGKRAKQPAKMQQRLQNLNLLRRAQKEVRQKVHKRHEEDSLPAGSLFGHLPKGRRLTTDGFGDGSIGALIKHAKHTRFSRFSPNSPGYDASVFQSVDKHEPKHQSSLSAEKQPGKRMKYKQEIFKKCEVERGSLAKSKSNSIGSSNSLVVADVPSSVNSNRPVPLDADHNHKKPCGMDRESEQSKSNEGIIARLQQHVQSPTTQASPEEELTTPVRLFGLVKSKRQLTVNTQAPAGPEPKRKSGPVGTTRIDSSYSFLKIIAKLDASYANSPATKPIISTCESTVTTNPDDMKQDGSNDTIDNNKTGAPQQTSLDLSCVSRYSDGGDGNAIDEENDLPEEELNVEGFFHNEQMYLREVSGTSNKVFSVQRDDNGALIQVGTWDKERKNIRALRRKSANLEVGTAALLYPFDVDSNDHCETPRIAYEHISPVLETISNFLNKSKSELCVWDPFFCTGAAAKHLHDLGFTNVYHENEDFYKYDGGKTSGPKDFDVIVTNPPYTADHIPNIIKFCHQQNKPFLLLLPNYVLHKYSKSLNSSYPSGGQQLKVPAYFYIWSEKRYLYRSPKGGRAKGTVRKDRKTSPFVSFWYCSLRDGTEGGGASGRLASLRALWRSKQKLAQEKLVVAKDSKTRPSSHTDDSLVAIKNFTKGHLAYSANDLPQRVLDRVNQQGQKHGGYKPRGKGKVNHKMKHKNKRRKN